MHIIWSIVDIWVLKALSACYGICLKTIDHLTVAVCLGRRLRMHLRAIRIRWCKLANLAIFQRTVNQISQSIQVSQINNWVKFNGYFPNLPPNCIWEINSFQMIEYFFSPNPSPKHPLSWPELESGQTAQFFWKVDKTFLEVGITKYSSRASAQQRETVPLVLKRLAQGAGESM